MKDSKFIKEYNENLEKGKAWCRSKGIKFTRFKELVSRYMKGTETFTEDFWVFQYECYADGQHCFKQSVKEWAYDHYEDFTMDKHECCLKKNLK